MATDSKKMVYFFGGKKAEGNGKMKDLLGGKGANLAEMVNSGVPVPPGFTITTKVCNYFSDNKGKMPAGFDSEYSDSITKMEKAVGKKFGDLENPLLVSVRSGAKFSMPGMMDTILNLGLNEKTVEALATKSGNRWFALDAYRRFIQMFSDVVLEVEKALFEEILEDVKKSAKVKLDTELVEQDLEIVIKKYKDLVKKQTGKEFPTDPMTQLAMARDAVFKSWNNPRAFTYRRMNKIADDLSTAVNVQAMVFGNMGNDSATGVGFTRNPSTGVNEFYGEYLTNAQGEDVVAGIRTPKPIIELKKEMPAAFKELKDITDNLEKHYRDIQDFEFTIEQGVLYMLQTRVGKRTAHAAVKIAVDMVKEDMITKEEAIMRVEPEGLNQLLHPVFDAKVKYDAVATGLPASPGAAVGKVVFTSEDAVKKADEKVILVRTETCPDDISGMEVAQGILTTRGGMTSHAAVVARGMGKCCVAGCEDIKVDEKAGKLIIAGKTIKEGDYISINGSTGEVILGQVPTIEPTLSGDFGTLMGWVNKTRRLGVRSNADIPRDAKTAAGFGAEGIGLCRTEHMFFDAARLPLMQKMILVDSEADRRKALEKLLPFQKEDFKGLFEEMKGYSVTVRLLDPPLHEFLPKTKEEAKELSKKIGIDEKIIWSKTEDLHEFNPMLGHRGCRLGITYPEITKMQTKAIISAACELLKKKNVKVVPEIMVPLVGNVSEFKDQKDIIDATAAETMKEYGVKVKYMVGTMIEVPRAAVTADEIAEVADFFSFGTNDLTQMTLGFSRDDAGKFIKVYIDKKIFAADPFQTLDVDGVGQLVKMGIEKGRSVKEHLKIGICGEHGGDPDSVKFCHRAGMDYISCSPYRVPIACLAAAQAVIEEKDSTNYSSK
ncbi:MAG: pyruvate, phosphate dikinase [Candidatus Berkelbacteria bacterium]|nr:pyruvate, phosphate dikinase [Candidatus Berkelbacteria bacterium]